MLSTKPTLMTNPCSFSVEISMVPALHLVISVNVDVCVFTFGDFDGNWASLLLKTWR